MKKKTEVDGRKMKTERRWKKKKTEKECVEKKNKRKTAITGQEGCDDSLQKLCTADRLADLKLRR